MRWWVLLLIAFLVWQGWTWYHQLRTIPCTPPNHCLEPLFNLTTHPHFDVGLFISPGLLPEHPSPTQLRRLSLKPFWKRGGVDVTRDAMEEVLKVPLDSNTRKNGTQSLVAVLVPSIRGGGDGGATTRAIDEWSIKSWMENPSASIVTAVPLTRYKPQSLQDERYLIGGGEAERNATSRLGLWTTHWKPWVKLRYVVDTTLRDPPPGGSFTHYSPTVYFDELHLPSNALVPLSEDTTRDDPYITFKFQPTSLVVWKVLSTLEQSMQMMRQQFQFGDAEIDEVLMLLSPDRLYVLLLTYVVVFLHTVFAALALKSEIAFWSGSRDFYGMSRRSVIGNAVCSVILFLFLWDSVGTSWIVLLTMGANTILDLWKVTKVLGWSRELSEAEKQTNEIDAMGMRYLYWLLWPLLAGWATYSLLYYRHRSWYSWAITCAAHGVYGFGFLM